MYLPLDTYVSRPVTRSPPPRSIRPADRDPLPPPRSIEPRLPPSPTTWSVNSDLAIRSNPIRPCPGIRISPYETIVSKLYHSHHTHSACKFPLYHRKVACKPVDNSCQPLSPALPRSPPPKLSLSPTNCDYVSPSATEPNQCRGRNRHLTSSFNY